MRIRKASIRNIQAIKTLDWMPRKKAEVGWHVILGDNGSGKTSFLRAIVAQYHMPSDLSFFPRHPVESFDCLDIPYAGFPYSHDVLSHLLVQSSVRLLNPNPVAQTMPHYRATTSGASCNHALASVCRVYFQRCIGFTHKGPPLPVIQHQRGDDSLNILRDDSHHLRIRQFVDSTMGRRGFLQIAEKIRTVAALRFLH